MVIKVRKIRHTDPSNQTFRMIADDIQVKRWIEEMNGAVDSLSVVCVIRVCFVVDAV